ncbi:MAG: nitroreductase family protein, partial [Chitinophagales bacterium]
MYFYASPYADQVDPYIPATYAMLTAESLGLGCCMIGTIGYFMKYEKKLSAKYGIPPRSTAGLAMIFGYPRFKYSHALKRTFAQVRYY